MKPKPLEELKNFTVPMVMMDPLRMIVPTDVRTAKTSSREVSGPGARAASRDGRFFWSSRAGTMRLYLGKYKAGGICERAAQDGDCLNWYGKKLPAIVN